MLTQILDRRWRASLLLLAVLPFMAAAQDIEPRRWTPLPIGTKVVGVGYGYTDGDLFFDPVLQLEDVSADISTVAASYVQTLNLSGRPVRFDALAGWHRAEWEGRLQGTPASTSRSGLSDPRFRLSVHLKGDPALSAKPFSSYMASRKSNTVVGAALSVTVPWGEYFDDRLLNLGQNRYVIRPQIGVLHTRGLWSYELSGSVFFFTDNDDFFANTKREQDPLYAVQSHLVRVFRPGVWASISAGYGWGGKSKIDSVSKDDERGDVLMALSAGLPLTRSQGMKVAYVRGIAGNDVGSDTDTYTVAWSIKF